MKFRELGSLKIRVSEVGFGGWGIGGDLYGKISDIQALNTLSSGYDQGINFFDTSSTYGDGRSEELIGQKFAGLRDKVVIATKGGSKGHYLDQDFSAAYIVRSLEDSLKRLKTDYIDLYQLHSPPIEDIKGDEELLRSLEELCSSGKVRMIGVSARSPEDALLAIQDLGIESVQVNFNLVDQRAHQIGLFEACRQKNASAIIRTPLCFGFLSGSFTQDTEFDDETDHRGHWSESQRKVWADAWRKFDEARREENISPVQFALLFCLAFPGIASVIPGMMNENEVMENTSISDLAPLTLASLEKAFEIYSNETFFLGRSAQLRSNPATGT